MNGSDLYGYIKFMIQSGPHMGCRTSSLGCKEFWPSECHGARYITHFYCLAVEAGFYSDVVECLPVDPATWVRFPAGTGKIFSLYDNGAHRK